MTERTLNADSHSNVCLSLDCPCYQDGIEVRAHSHWTMLQWLAKRDPGLLRRALAEVENVEVIDDGTGERWARECPDEGTCHHACADGDRCWRVQNAEPLSAAGWGDTWPLWVVLADAIDAHTSAAHGYVLDTTQRDDMAKRLAEAVSDRVS